MSWLINNSTGCKKWIPKNNYNLHIKVIKTIKNHIKNYTNKQIKLTNYKNCLYNVNKSFKIINTTDQEHENLKNSKNELLQKLKNIYDSKHKIKINIIRGSGNLNQRSTDNNNYMDYTVITVYSYPYNPYLYSNTNPQSSCTLDRLEDNTGDPEEEQAEEYLEYQDCS